ncbi:PQQ-binding-like beta-propeller repeat protein [Micromonospora eburnea]|uniref:Outer membrane protein assembly factor BamB, contains PQQ-like beta-propeller repeat n=1 Tax=Micromonospora eburnea TaxID=227316 RepID=A0A1C6U0X2_9ACTN|nr:PQQ-binding-like beta-propeller repeat protein [Micromonospora eburnea]SCL47694.1 Outer membrane protein assembly factor BamB, contains PQQ-like beta-propeller repeat [Micromonospora eburnea]
MIELGELRHGDEPEPSPAPRRPSAASARVVALCCAVLLTLAGAAPVPRLPSGVTVPASPDAGFLVLADRLVVATGGPGTTGRGDRLVSGYRLPDGAPVWRFRPPAGDDLLGLWTVAGLLLVASGSPDDGRTAALDPRTGATRWQQPGYPTLTEAGGVILETSGADGRRAVRAVNPATGTARWSLPSLGDRMVYGFGGRGVTAMVVLGGDGQVEVYDADSGSLRRADRLPSTVDQSYRWPQVLGDVLLFGDASGEVTAYGLDRLDRRWTLPARSEDWFADCGELICLSGRSTGLWAYDPATGRLRWRDDRWRGAFPVDGRLLVDGPTERDVVELAVLDPGTGRTLARLGRWRLTAIGSRSLGIRSVTGDRTLVAELDVSAGQARTLAVLPGSWNGCTAAAAVLVCQRRSSGLVIWPLDR